MDYITLSNNNANVVEMYFTDVHFDKGGIIDGADGLADVDMFEELRDRQMASADSKFTGVKTKKNGQIIFTDVRPI